MSCRYFQISTSVLWLIIIVPRVAPIAQTLWGHSTAPAKLNISGMELNVKVPLFDKIFKPIRNSRLSGSVWLSEPSFFRLFVCPCVRHSAFLLKGWNRPLPSSRTLRNYGVRTRLRAKSPSSIYRIKSRANERKFPETGC